MPSGLNEEQRAYARDVFTKLCELHRQEDLAKEFGVHQGTISKAKNKGEVGAKLLMAGARKLGRPRAEVDKTLSLQVEDSPNEPQRFFESDRVHPVIASVRKPAGFSREEATEASRLVFNFGGTADLTHKQAVMLLEKARVDLRNNQLIVGSIVGDSGGSALEELSPVTPVATPPPSEPPEGPQKSHSRITQVAPPERAPKRRRRRG